MLPLTHIKLFQHTFLFGLILFGVSMLFSYGAMANPTLMPLTGYAWSSEAGWISFSGSGYGVFEDPLNGSLSGYAWSSSVGWISFNASQVSGCPSGSCPPSVNVNTGKVSGWARACAAFEDKNACSGALDPNSSGWDGWINLKGTAQDGTTYQVTQGADCAWSGYAWGSDILGAISMQGTASDGSSYGVRCIPPPTVTFTASPTSINTSETSTLTWISSADATACTSAGGFSTGDLTTGSVVIGPLATTQSYAVTCTGPGGSTNATVTVEVNPSVVSIDAIPDRVRVGSTTQVTWSGSNINSCTIKKNGSSWQNLPAGPSQTISGSSTDHIALRTTYTLTCNTGATATKTVNTTSTYEGF